MKPWPLRWKLALYAAVLAVIATIAGALTTWLVLHYSEIAALDRRLAASAHEFLQNLNAGPGRDLSLAETMAPLTLSDRFVELRTADGTTLYHSPNLGTSSLDDGIAKLHTHRIGGRTLRIAQFQDRDLRLWVAADLADINQIGWDIVLGMFAAIPTVLIVITIGGRWVARKALAPVDAIREAASRITARNLDQRLPLPPAADEIAALISVLNSTFDRLQRSFEQSVRFSAEASHHLKTPISVLRAGIEEILTDPETPPKQQSRADALLHQIHQLTSIAENLLTLARADAGRLEFHREEFDLGEVLDGVCDDARALAEPHDLTVEEERPSKLPLIADRRSVALILQNLVENAIKYNGPGGRICIHALAVDGIVEVIVKNNGEPIPPERAPHIFERFYRAQSDRRIPGQGLGLSVASELAKAQGGDLKLVRSDPVWTEFRLHLPRG
jgi:signal transduction histidine kinase